MFTTWLLFFFITVAKDASLLMVLLAVIALEMIDAVVRNIDCDGNKMFYLTTTYILGGARIDREAPDGFTEIIERNILFYCRHRVNRILFYIVF